MVLFFVMLYFLAKGLFWILSLVAPILLIATLIIDHKVILDYGKFIFKLLKDNPLVGILGVLLTVVGFPVVSGFLFFKALARRTINSKLEAIKKERQGEYAEYEEIVEDVEFLELPQVEKVERNPSSNKGNEYEDFFEE